MLKLTIMGTPDPSYIALFRAMVDHVALVYHEGRNVRHLIRAGAIDLTGWKYLVALPMNRDSAWAELQDVRQAARMEASVAGSLCQFESRFHVALVRLEELYGHAAWRNSKCGGNAWLGITKLVRRFADCLDCGLVAEAAGVHQSLRSARHNTGSVAEKLAGLERTLSAQLAG